jgi:FG-GAP-like repeat
VLNGFAGLDEKKYRDPDVASGVVALAASFSPGHCTAVPAAFPGASLTHVPLCRISRSPMKTLELLFASLACLGGSVLGLERMNYNQPGLVVDLGVGLWAWPVPCDADGDGDFDLIVSCPDKPSNGVYLFENAAGDTAKNKMPVFRPALRLSGTVHYVMPSYVDGKLRVLSPATEYPNFEKTGTAERVRLPVAAHFYKPEGTARGGPRMRHNQWRYADYDGDGRQDLVVGIEDWSHYGWDNAYDDTGAWKAGPLHGFVHVFRATDGGGYAEPFLVQAGGGPVDTFGCPSPNFADFDGDGDLDLLCGEFLDGFTYFENAGSRTAPGYAPGRRVKDAGGAEVRMELEMIVPVALDWDKDGDFDLIVGDEDGRVALVENTGKLAERMPVFAQPAYFKQEADTLKCGALATPVGVDWDGDGDTDIVSGNTAGFVEFFENLSGARVAAPKWAAPRRLEANGKPLRVMAGPNGSIQGPAEAKWGYTTLSVADWDGDGLHDIVLNSILGDVVWLRNTGTRAVPALAAPQPVEVEWAPKQPALAWGWRKPAGRALLTQWRTTPVVFDFNRDGLPDLGMLDHEGYLAFFEREKRDGKLLLKAPRRAFVDEKGSPLRLNAGTAGKSGRRKLCVADWDGDGKFDFLLNSSNADFLQQVGERDGVWIFRNSGTLAKKNIEGHDVSPAVVDFDGDGVPDFLGGAEDGRFYFLKNPRSR